MQSELISKIEKVIRPIQSNSLTSGHRLGVLIYSNFIITNDFEKDITNLSKNSILISKSNTLKANDIIGHEYDMVVINICHPFDPNLFSAISGTLKSGGLFILLCQTNQNINTPFYSYVFSAIENNTQFLKIKISDENLITSLPKLIDETKPETGNPFEQQENAIKLIKKVLTGHRKRPLVLTANRGRGKSAAIGIAIGQLISQQTETNKTRPIKIMITAPSLAASAIIFKHIKQTVSPEHFTSNHISFNENNVFFISPDNLLQKLPDMDLLIVDEAAGINNFILESILKHYSRVVLATTLHGYEGSGQGFLTRFTKKLDTLAPNWKSVSLEKPIRWNSNDPLESFINNTFLLSANDDSTDTSSIDATNIETRIIHQESLLSDTRLLNSIFYILKSAHYKTTPNDLRQLMDSENSVIFACYYNNEIIAAAITEKEGNLPPDLVDEIYKGERRPKGELLPQSIVMHLGIKEAAELHYLRVMRIAVKPELQGKKIGSKLLESITLFSKEKKFDFIGCSFGATDRLLKFWYSQDFHTFRLGYKKNGFSGSNAALLVKPLTEKAEKISKEANIIFFDNFISQLSDSLNDLDASLVATILKRAFKDREKVEITKKTLRDIESFAKHNRSYDDNLSSIKSFILNTGYINTLSKTQLNLIVLKILQNNSWPETSNKLGLKGKSQTMSELKLALTKILEKNFNCF